MEVKLGGDPMSPANLAGAPGAFRGLHGVRVAKPGAFQGLHAVRVAKRGWGYSLMCGLPPLRHP